MTTTRQGRRRRHRRHKARAAERNQFNTSSPTYHRIRRALRWWINRRLPAIPFILLGETDTSWDCQYENACPDDPFLRTQP